MKNSTQSPDQDDYLMNGILHLRLYVAGKSPNSVRALANLRAICREHLSAGRWNLEVVDLYKDPMRAVEDKIHVTPTLLKLTPPLVQIVGDLSQQETVLAALGLVKDAE
jgi:circadian clock protein KaiB